MNFLLPFLLSCSAVFGATVYVSTTGNDGTAVRGDPTHPTLTLTNAVAMSQAGDTIQMGSGTFPLGTNRVFLGNITLQGTSRELSTITGGGLERMIILTNSVVLRDFTLTSTNRTGASVFPIFSNPYLDHVVPTIVFTNIAVNGQSDNVSINSTNIVHCRVDNCFFSSVYDTFLVYNFQPLSDYQFRGCSFAVAKDPTLFGDEARAMVVNGGPSVAITGCSFSASNFVTRTWCLYNVLGNLTIRSTSFKSVASTGTAYAINQEGGTSVVYGSSYDPTKVSVTGGDLSYTSAGTERFVATSGSDSDSGTATTPWLTIGKATSTATSGQIVNVGPGTYNEFVTNTVSGTLGSPITFSGGGFSTVIDPSTSISTGWTLDGSLSNGVYSNTAPWQVYEMTLDNKQVMYVYAMGNIASELVKGWPTIATTTGAQIISSASNFSVTPRYNNVAVPFWDGVEALWCSTNTTVWLRLRDGSSPNGRSIRIAPNGSPGAFLRTEDLNYPSIYIGASNIVWQNAMVRGGRGQMLLDGVPARNVTIRSNYFSGGVQRIFMYSGCASNTITGNTFAADYYGGTNHGAWTEPGTTFYATRESSGYEVLKHLMGNDGSLNYDIYGINIGNGNSIVGNTFLAGAVGVEIQGSTANPTVGLTISSNWFGNHASLAVAPHDGTTQVDIYHNTFIDNNLSIREHDMGATGETNRIHRIYRNVSWLPQGVGEHIYFYWDAPIANGYYPETWIYHNSFAGGFDTINFGQELDYNDGGVQNCRILNNIADGPFIFTYNPFATNSTACKADYNLKLLNLYYNGTYEGSHTLTNSTPEWAVGFVPNWFPKIGSRAIGSALDTSTTFTLQSTSFPALPDDGTSKMGLNWTIGALETRSTINIQITNLFIRATP